MHQRLDLVLQHSLSCRRKCQKTLSRWLTAGVVRAMAATAQSCKVPGMVDAPAAHPASERMRRVKAREPLGAAPLAHGTLAEALQQGLVHMLQGFAPA